MYDTTAHNDKVHNSVASLCDEPYVLSNKEKDMLAYVLEKSLRISSATHLLVALMDKDIPLRAPIERTCVGLVEHAAASVEHTRARVSLQGDLRTLGALLESGALAGMLAPSNVDILRESVSELHTYLATTEWGMGRRHGITPVLTTAVGEGIWDIEKTEQRTQTYQRHTSPVSATEKGHTDLPEQRVARTVQKDTTRQAPQDYRERVQDIQKDRRATILSLMQRKDRITVRDVAAVIKDCSEKTLQRELLALVGQGVLVKEGERRWSTYRLA